MNFANEQLDGAAARPRRVLVTGCNGFTGRHLVERLRATSEDTVIGLDVGAKAHVYAHDYAACDLTDSDGLQDVMRAIHPDVVYHLAGVFQAASDEDYHRINVGGFANLCHALRNHAQGKIRMVTVGSAAEIGPVEEAQLPVNEEIACRPVSAYGRSKLEITWQALAEPAESGLEIVVARTFNLVGPGLSAKLALGNFAGQIARAMRDEDPVVRCGPLDGRRDFVDVRDAASAYVALAERGRRGAVYNICGGRSHRMGDLLQELIELSGVDVRVESNDGACSKGVDDIYGTHAKLTRDTGWEPEVAIGQSLRELFESAGGAIACLGLHGTAENQTSDS